MRLGLGGRLGLLRRFVSVLPFELWMLWNFMYLYIYDMIYIGVFRVNFWRVGSDILYRLLVWHDEDLFTESFQSLTTKNNNLIINHRHSMRIPIRWFFSTYFNPTQCF